MFISFYRDCYRRIIWKPFVNEFLYLSYHYDILQLNCLSHIITFPQKWSKVKIVLTSRFLLSMKCVFASYRIIWVLPFTFESCFNQVPAHSFISCLFQIACVMTTCTRVGGRVWRSHPPAAGSGVTSMTAPRATTPGPAATAPPTTGAARRAGSRSRVRKKVGGKVC